MEKTMNNEIIYTKNMPLEHIKKYGQFFTNSLIADFMCSWACCDARTILDPAVGNSVFFIHTKKYNKNSEMTGYEIDSKILNYFGNPTNANIINNDYLFNDWEKKYDAIICNPPYNKFQSVSNRMEIIDIIEEHTGIKYSTYTNLYILFLMKSIFQMSENGKLAYIIPTEFLNSDYGVPIKQLLLKQHLLRAIINFENNQELFFNATTTCCIILLDKQPKSYVEFYNLSNINDLKNISIGTNSTHCVCKNFEKLNAKEKWRAILNQEEICNYRNLTYFSKFCNVSRGIATGANSFFCLSYTEALENKIPFSCLTKCICKSADVKTAIFTEENFDQLVNDEKKVFLLDIGEEDAPNVDKYIEKGREKGIDKRYLPSCRFPWFSMEQKKVAPIWVSSGYRSNMKFVRNLAEIKTLTTFHSVYINKDYEFYTDVIFCYLLTPIAQKIIRENRKELGNGFNKFQPNDLNNAQMLDISMICENDIIKIQKIYHDMKYKITSSHLEELNNIFLFYLL